MIKAGLVCIVSALCLRAAEMQVQFDPSASHIQYTVDSVLHTVKGTFQLKSGTVRFDPATRTVAAGSMPVMKKDPGTVVSADGRWAAFIRGPAGRRELWARSVAEGTAERIAGGRCDNGEPAWELDSSAVVFASDCSRAYGLPALYHAPVASWLGQPRK